MKNYEEFNSLKQKYFRELESYINMFDHYVTHYMELTHNQDDINKSNQKKFIVYLKNNINRVIAKLLTLDGD